MMNRPDGPRTVAFALCGSFCSFSAVLPQVRRLRALGWRVLPILSCSAAALDTRFGTAAALRAQLQEMTGETPLTTLQQVAPLGPKVTLAAKSLLRGGRPVVLAPSTNDALSGSAPAIAQLLQRRNYYFVPFGQDDSYKKPCSLKSDFTLIPDTLESALRGVQLQPILL